MRILIAARPARCVEAELRAAELEHRQGRLFRSRSRASTVLFRLEGFICFCLFGSEKGRSWSAEQVILSFSDIMPSGVLR
jgi:hypothetical protein